MVRESNGRTAGAPEPERVSSQDSKRSDPALSGLTAADPASGAWFLRHRRGTGLAAAGVVVIGVAAVGVATGSALVQPASFDATSSQTAVVATDPVAEPAIEPLDFAPIEAAGEGDGTVPIELPTRAAEDVGPVLQRSERVLLTFTHDGSSNVAVWSLDSDGQPDELLVNSIGAYTGTTTLLAESTALAVEADGTWTATVSPTSAALVFTEATDGTGDAVVRYVGEARPLDLQHLAEGAFFVVAHLPDGTSDLLVNEVGEFEGRIDVPEGTLLEVTADGEWSLTAG